MKLYKLCNFLNNFLDMNKFKDYSLNGLQVENNGYIEKIFAAVDANIYTIKKCEKNSILIVHHGIFWNKTFPLTGSDFEKIKYLINNNIALYASHLPLDAHGEIGNNALLIKSINAEITGNFGEYYGNFIGYKGELEEEKDIFFIAEKLKFFLNEKIKIFNFSNKQKIKTVCAVSGSPGREILNEFKKSQIDLFITGESNHELYNFAEDNKLNIICAGHYATEKIGIKALGDYASKEFLIEFDFIDHPTGE